MSPEFKTHLIWLTFIIQKMWSDQNIKFDLIWLNITDHNFSDATKPQTALTRAMKITANLSSLRWQMPMVVQIISGYHSIRLPMNIKIIRLSMNIRSWLDESIKDHFYPRRLFIGAKNERISSGVGKYFYCNQTQIYLQSSIFKNQMYFPGQLQQEDCSIQFWQDQQCKHPGQHQRLNVRHRHHQDCRGKWWLRTLLCKVSWYLE